MERHKELKKQNTAIPESQEAVQNLSLRQKKHRIPLQNLVLSSMTDCDLFATLFYLYFYCMAECTDDVGYAWYSEDFSRAIKGKEYDFLYEKDVMDNDETDKSFIGSFDSLKKAAVDYYGRADDRQRKRFDSFMNKIGWKFDEVIGEYHNIVNETILFYEQSLNNYLDLFGAFYFSGMSVNDWLGTMSIHAGKNIYPYKIHRLAYWYYAISESINKGWADYWWWEQSAMTGDDLFDLLTEIEAESEISLEKTRDATLDLIGRALKNMQPIIERISKTHTR